MSIRTGHRAIRAFHSSNPAKPIFFAPATFRVKRSGLHVMAGMLASAFILGAAFFVAAMVLLG